MFNLETLRLIRKTFRRFLPLSLIVFIGSGFMMGLMSTPRVMRESVDRYLDETEVSDLVVYSPYGFCNEDYIKLSETEGIKTVFASGCLRLISWQCAFIGDNTSARYGSCCGKYFWIKRLTE